MYLMGRDYLAVLIFSQDLSTGKACRVSVKCGGIILIFYHLIRLFCPPFGALLPLSQEFIQ
jgi:hypothetical protein